MTVPDYVQTAAQRVIDIERAVDAVDAVEGSICIVHPDNYYALLNEASAIAYWIQGLKDKS